MRGTCFSFLFLLLALNGLAQNAKTATIVIKTKIYCDHCLQCNSCGHNLNDAINKNKGIKMITINPKSNTIEVIYNPQKTTPEKIRTAIVQSGFDADELKADATKQNQLDGCCKKAD